MKNAQREAVSFNTSSRIVDKKTSFGLKKFGQETFRSSYEYAFAVYLREIGIEFEYEPTAEPFKTMTGTTLHYIPDFFLPEYNAYVEIVNQLTASSRYKMFHFVEQNPSKPLIVLDKKALRDMFDSKITIFDIFSLKGIKKKG